MTETQSSNPTTETAVALTELCARTEILEMKMQKNIDETRNISSKMLTIMEMMREIEKQLDSLGVPRLAEKQPMDQTLSSPLPPTPISSTMIHGATSDSRQHQPTPHTGSQGPQDSTPVTQVRLSRLDVFLVERTCVQKVEPDVNIANNCSSETGVFDALLNEFGAVKDMQYEVTPKEIQYNFFGSFSSLKVSHRDVGESVSKWVYQTEISSGISCTQGVRQNAEENLILCYLRAKPPEEYLNATKMLKAKNGLYYGVHCHNGRLKAETKIFHNGSISLIVESYRSVHLNEVEIAREYGELLSLDPNLRIPLWPSKEEAHKLVSDSEVEFLTDGKIDDASALSLWCPNMKLMSLTCGEKCCFYHINDFNGTVEGSHVETINRTGVGDSLLIGAGALLRKLVNDHSVIEQVNSRAAPLPCDAKAEDLESFFSQLAKIISVRFTKHVAEKRMFSGTALIEFLSEKEAEKVLTTNDELADGVLVPGGFGDRCVQGKILAAKYARENKVQYLGICLGMQTAVIEFARSVLGMEDANSTEFNDQTSHPCVIFMPEGSKTQLGGTMRLGLRKIYFNNMNCKAAKLYGDESLVDERRRHRYEVNPTMIEQFEKSGLSFVGKDETGCRMELIENCDHPYFIVVQFHPEFKSRPRKRSPLFLELIAVASGQLDTVLQNCMHTKIPSTKQEMSNGYHSLNHYYQNGNAAKYANGATNGVYCNGNGKSSNILLQIITTMVWVNRELETLENQHIQNGSICTQNALGVVELVMANVEVLASKTKIYMVLEYVNGGELFDRIVSVGKFSELRGRRLFQQLIDGVGYCHDRGVFHRDLKLENLLIDKKGNLKISDFGLSALPQHFRDDGLLHTTCGTPNYVAPEILTNRGYDGAQADVWSCGVILYVILTGSLPFEDRNLVSLYQKILKGDVNIPNWLSPGAQRMIRRILDPNPNTRITMEQLKEDEWFKQGYVPASPYDDEEDNSIREQALVLHDAYSSDSDKSPKSPAHINAFELIGMSCYLDLSGFFEKEEVSDRKIRFTSGHSLNDLLEKIEETVTDMGLFQVQKNNGKLKIMQPKNQKRLGSLVVAAEVFELSPSLYVIELRKSRGDSALYRQLCKKLTSNLGAPQSPEMLAAAV